MSESDQSRVLPRNNTYAQATESVLREMILDGSIGPGQRLNEVTLASSLGISRGPLREAIQRLTSEGLLTVISHRGAFVRTFSRDEIVELYELRAALELHAVRLVCARASDAELEDLDALLSDTESRMRESTGHTYPQELDFHLRLVLLAGNQALMRSALEVHRQLSLARSMSGQRPTRARAAVVEHAELVAVLRARDLERATALMIRHLDHSMASAIAVLGLPGDEDAPTTRPDERRGVDGAVAPD
ncbi:transcriptional regulator, GntR family [Streptomyces zhaozhouensis]|uniref:Transcriptional regulator, GntR family n=1 Tax=Streptomyces zhaozhouensis TaxID=1300267 RepID=A0A286DK20_9ACTN|nr:GntR family transcriptional regulator [Streptomyces zhaozhouensis]SOD59097.1 transcriptional regulator, GntR family [Streptomyces zhaozhouensis]